MSLEKVISKGKNLARNILCAGLVALSLTSCPNPIPPEPKPKYDYTTTVKTVDSQEIDSSSGGVMEITDTNSLIYGTALTIPGNALQSDTTISIGEVNNPPVLPAGLNYVGTPVSLEPDGINFNSPLTIQIPYHDESLSDAGISDDSNLGLYFYDKSSSTWNSATILSIDRDNNIITAEINHFSYYAITCLNGIPPEDLGIPQPGDLLYTLGAFWNEGDPLLKNNWMTGHVGIYVGEKQYSGGLASDAVKNLGKYNVVEALWDGVQFSYYSPISTFSGLNTYMGTREPEDFTLTQEQREEIVAYVEAQVEKPYAWEPMIKSIFGLLPGYAVKGPDSFNCVGLAEAAYEFARVNNGEGLVTNLNEERLLTPAEQYNSTKPAVGANKISIISFTGWGTENYNAQLAIMNEDGSDIQEITSGFPVKNYPRLSPNRNKIIFESRTKDEYGYDISTLYTINVNGSGLTELIGSSESIHPAWSSQNKIAFVTQWNLIEMYIANIDFSNKERLTATQTTGYAPSFSPDGNDVIYTSNQGDIIKVNIASKNSNILIPKTDKTFNHHSEFSPDGKKIAFSSNMYEEGNRDIYLYDVASTNIERLTYNSSVEYSPCFSKDGSKIFFASELGEAYQIFSMNLNGSGQKQLTYGPKDHDFGFYNN